MVQRKTMEYLVTKYDGAFKDLRELKFSVEFPNGDKSVMRPMIPSQYRTFMALFESAIQEFRDTSLTKFEIMNNDGKVIDTVLGDDVTQPGSEVWERDVSGEIIKDDSGKKVQKRDEDGNLIFKEPTKTRIKVDEDFKEYPRENVKIIYPKMAKMLKKFEATIWDNAAKILGILFPDDKTKFTQEYVAAHLNIPFMKMVLELTVDINGLDFIVPFMRSLSPAMAVLLGGISEQKS